MDAHLLVRSKFMVSREFGTLDIPKEPLVTIVDVKKPDMEEETTKGWWLVTFAESWAKPLKVNATHREALALMFGWETDHWRGKKIGLYAMVGEFFGRRQTAVRIKGSPDLKEPRSFSVQRFGGGRDIYNLVPMAEASSKGNGHAPKKYPPTGTVDFGPKKGTKIPALTKDELAAAIALATDNITKAAPGAGWVAKTQANLDELLAEERMRAEAARAAVEQAAPGAEDAPF